MLATCVLLTGFLETVGVEVWIMDFVCGTLVFLASLAMDWNMKLNVFTQLPGAVFSLPPLFYPLSHRKDHSPSLTLNFF